MIGYKVVKLDYDWSEVNPDWSAEFTLDYDWSYVFE